MDINFFKEICIDLSVAKTIELKKKWVYSIPVIFFLIFIIKVPAKLMGLKPIDPYHHTFRAFEILKGGWRGVYWEDYVYAHMGGRASMYPPVYHIILALVIRWFGIYWANFAVSAGGTFLLYFSTWFAAYNFIGKDSSVLAPILLFTFPIRVDRWYVPLPYTYFVTLSLLFLGFFMKKNKIVCGVLLSLIIYLHYAGVMFFISMLAMSFLSEKYKDMGKVFIIPFVLFLPFAVFFARHYFDFEREFDMDKQKINDSITEGLKNLQFIILVFLSLIGWKFLKEKELWIYIIGASFVFWMVTSKLWLFTDTIGPVLAVIGSGFIKAVGKKTSKIVVGLCFFIPIVLIFNPYFLIRIYKNSLWVIGASGFYNETTHGVILFSTGYESIAQAIRNRSGEDEIIYCSGEECALISLLADRKITGGWARDWIPKNMSSPYQRVNFFKTEVPNGFVGVYENRNGIVAIRR